MSNVPSRAKRAAGVVGTSAAVAALGLAAAGTAQATPYATGWQCISPFANFTNNTFPDDPPAPNQILDSLAIGLGRSGNDTLVAEKGKTLKLDDAQVRFELKDPRPATALYTRSGGVSISYAGTPFGQPSGDSTRRTMSKVAITPALAAAIQATATNPGGGTAPADGEQWWAFTVSNQAPGSAANLNTGWYSDGAPNANGNVTRTYYTERVDGNTPPQDNAGGAIQPSASVGHYYIKHTGDNRFPLATAVVVEATNTVEKVQTLQAEGTWVVNVQDPTPGSLANPAGFTDGGHTVTVAPVTINLPTTKWTPTGAGPVEFKLAAPGQSAAVISRSTGYDRPGYNRAMKLKPYGSVWARFETESYGASTDCIPGTISIANPSIQSNVNSAAAFFGNARPDATAASPDTSVGDLENPGFYKNNSGAWVPAVGGAGRYAFAFTAQPAFAVAQLPVARPVTGKALRVTSTSLKKSKSNRVSLKVQNPNGVAAGYRVTIKTTAKYKVGKSRKTVTVVSRSSVQRPAAGKTKTSSLKLTSSAKTLLKSRKSLRVKVTVTSTNSKAKSTSKTLTLKR